MTYKTLQLKSFVMTYKRLQLKSFVMHLEAHQVKPKFSQVCYFMQKYVGLTKCEYWSLTITEGVQCLKAEILLSNLLLIEHEQDTSHKLYM